MYSAEQSSLACNDPLTRTRSPTAKILAPPETSGTVAHTQITQPPARHIDESRQACGDDSYDAKRGKKRPRDEWSEMMLRWCDCLFRSFTGVTNKDFLSPRLELFFDFVPGPHGGADRSRAKKIQTYPSREQGPIPSNYRPCS